MTVPDLFWAIILGSLLLLLGTVLALRVSVLQRLFLPGSIIAGFLALLIGPQGIGYWLSEYPGGLIPETVYAAWKGFPGVLINVVFAALFLGHPVPGLREIWRRAGPQVAFGQALAWGQYVVGLGLAMLVLVPVYGMSPLVGTLIEVGFEGGHGTAAGMAGTFRDLGFAEGGDLALALATVGIVSGILIGTALVNWAARRKIIQPSVRFEESALPQRAGQAPAASAGTAATDPLAVHFGIVGLAVGVGWCIKQALLWIEGALGGGAENFELIRYVPLFPLAMIGGLIVQIVADRTGYARLINRRLMNRISGTALDFTIVAALGTLSLSAIKSNLAPFLILAFGGILWTVLVLLLLAPRMIPTYWFVRGIGDFGQSTGVTVTGLLLMRMADPQNKSGALESFGYKQLLFEPVVGGGLFTAAAPLLVLRFGAGPVFVLTSVVTLFWVLFGMLAFGRAKDSK